MSTLVTVSLTTALIAKYTETPAKGYAAGAVVGLFLYSFTFVLTSLLNLTMLTGIVAMAPSSM